MIGKKLLHGFLAVTMGVTLVIPAGTMNVRAEDQIASAPQDVTVTEFTANNAKSGVDVDIVLGNQFMSRTFNVNNDKLSTKTIINKRTDDGETVFTPAAGSEEFIVNTVQTNSDGSVGPVALDRTGWTAEADSRQYASGDSDGPASNLLDGRTESIWHTNYGGGVGPQVMPHYVVFDLQKEQTIQAFAYTPRQQGEETNGNIKNYQLYISATKEGLDSVDSLVAEGSFKYDGVNPIYVNLDKAYKGQFVKLVAKSAVNGQQFAGGAEFNLYDHEVEIATGPKNAFKSSDLSIKGYSSENTTDKPGKKLTFEFEPFIYKDVEYTINEVLVMYDGDHFMRKFLEISIPDEDKATTAIDYIDLESMNVNADDQQWTIPTDAGGVVEMDQYKANLGQPIYIQGMFFGCEFPVTDTQIVEGNGFIRYYTGKTFDRLQKDNQLTKDGKYVTWQTVAGSARSTEMDVIQTDFFQYIDTIATPTDFRIQYNSWFDNMMLIDDANIETSFKAVEEEMSNTGVRPLDSYVVDDGWNNYNDTSIVDSARSGTTLNESGFWEFNSKFPEGLTISSDLVHNFGSDFGVWVGPRGGYNFYGSIANILTKSGKGSKAGGSIDVADRTYVKNFQDMTINFQENYGVNYWKWDGFADRSQFGAFPATAGVPGYANNHMTGGYKNMYHVTDLWEAWIDLFEAARDNAEEEGIDNLWLSLTCYVNPSPWYLQWANSVWLQCTHDRGETGPLGNKADNMLTYREAVYYDFINNHEFQFPLSNLYNHDPVYGKEGTGINVNSMTDEQFSNYLYAMAGRGTAFWELYYSDSLMNGDKYQVNAEFLEWLEANYHILKNAKMFGGNPANGSVLGGIGTSTKFETYGFSAWNGTDGIVTMRNPDSKEQTLTFKLDRNLGLPEGASNLNRTTVHSFKQSSDDSEYQTVNYGDEITVTLQPGEVRVWQLSESSDQSAPTIRNTFTTKNNVIHVEFNEKVTGDTFTVAGHEVASVRAVADHRSFEITLKDELDNGEKVTVTPTDIKDLADNVATGTSTLAYYANNIAVSVYESETAREISDETYAISGTNAFTVNANVTSSKTNALIMEQDGAYIMGIDADGYAYVEVSGKRVVSKTKVNTGNEMMVTGVKENNGLVKIFVNGELEGSIYDVNFAYKNFTSGKTRVGDVKISTGTAFTKALGYEEISKLADTTPETNLIPQSQMNATATSSDAKEGNLPANAIDGNSNTYWASSPEANNTLIPQYVMLDLGGAYNVEKVTYMTRHDAQSGIACTGNILEYVLETSEDGITWTTAKTGTFADDGKLQTIVLDEPIVANHVRIGATKTYHWNTDQENTVLNVGEINVYGTPDVDENWALNKNVTIKWIKDNADCDINPDRPASMATDGTINTNNYVDFGTDSRAEGTYLQVDLESSININKINLYRYWADGRTYKGSVIAVSDTPDFAEKTIVYNADKENFFGLGAGTDNTYAETSNGKTVNLSTPVKGRYVRLYMHGSATGNTNHVVELEVLGKKGSSTTVDKTALKALVAEASNYRSDAYTTNSFEALTTMIAEAQVVIDNAGATTVEVNAKLAKLKTAINNLVNVDALKAVITAAEKLNKNDYTVDSFAALTTALSDAESVLINGTNKSVADAVAAINTAVKNLVPVVEEDVTYTVLETAIKNANDIVAAGGLDGLAEIVVKQFQDALDAAVSVLANPNATQADRMEAWFNLATAMHYLDFHADKTQLNALIKEATIIEAKLDQYQETGKAEFIEALANAREVSASSTALDESINKAYERLSSAKNNLVLNSGLSYTVINYVIAEVDTAVSNKDYYEQNDAWTVFIAALANANDAVANATTQDEINIAANALADAYVDIRLIANEDRLAALEDFSSLIFALDAKLYSEEDYAIMQEAATYANQLFDSKLFTLEEFATFEELQENANDIMKNNVLQPDEPTDPSDPTVPADPEQPAETQTPNDPEGNIEVEEPAVPDTNNSVVKTTGTVKPATGDTTNTGLIVGVMVVALGIIGVVVFRKMKASKKVK